MKNKLLKLGFNEKESDVYMYLVEYGISPASEISRIIKIPKSTVNFIADNLWKKGILKKSFRGKTGYYEADIDNLEENILKEIKEKTLIIKDILPYLKEKNKNIISKPKITFIDGLNSCREAYLEILKIKSVENGLKTFYEFGSHEDLENAFGKEFMENFINSRIKKKIFCDSVGSAGEIEKNLQLNDGNQMRKLIIFPEILGNIKSTIVIYDKKVLILNLNRVFSGVIIENNEFCETMKTIFNICKS